MLSIFQGTMGRPHKDKSQSQIQPQQIILEGVERSPNGGEFKISLKLAAILQVVMMAAGAGATYTATRAAIEMDHQRLEDQSQSIRTLQISVQSAQQTLTGLTKSIEYLTNEVQAMQERLWNDRRTR